MTISITPELERQVQQRAKAEGLSVEAYLERLIREDEAWGEHGERALSESDPEFADIRAAVSEGLAQAEREESRAAEDVFAEWRARHGVSH